MNTHTRGFKKFILFSKTSLYFFTIIIFLIAVFFLNYNFKVKNISILFFDENQENLEIKKFTENFIRNKATSLYSYIILDQDEIFKEVNHDFEIVSDLKISKSFSLDLNVAITKNQEFFYTCMDDESNFLVKCMLGNIDGIFYKGLDNPREVEDFSVANEKVLIKVSEKALYDVKTEKRVEQPDSLSGTRIYLPDDFKVLREVLRWVQKNGFIIKKVEVGELKIVDIYTDNYKIKISLDKGYVDTVKDFELISRTGALEKYINGDKDKIEYIDLSYKNKVFYKLKSATKTDIMSTTTATSSTP